MRFRPRTKVTDETLYRYLLGTCPKAESSEIESAYLGDHRLFQRLVALETKILAAYERGELSSEDRERIKKHLIPIRKTRRARGHV